MKLAYEHDRDLKYEQLVGLLVLSQCASTSYAQRMLGLGFNAAARLIERAEADGFVSRPNAVGKREVLIGGTPSEGPA